MTIVNCEDRNCEFNQDGLCSKDEITIRTYDTTSCMDYSFYNDIPQDIMEEI